MVGEGDVIRVRALLSLCRRQGKGLVKGGAENCRKSVQQFRVGLLSREEID